MITIPVEVKPRPYAALIENGLLAKAGALLRELLPARSRLFVITVVPVRRKWGKVLMGSLAAAGFDAKSIEMPEGERFKRLATVETLAEKLTALGADRNAVVVAVGFAVYARR
jgi:3-dehydroquinate synthase